MKKQNRRNQRGQTIVEYVLIIAIVVVAAIGVLSAFSDTVRNKISGIVHVFGDSENEAKALSEVGESSEDKLKALDKDGLN